MTAPQIDLPVIAVALVGALFCVAIVAEVIDIVRVLKNWRAKPDLVIGLFVIALMVVLTSCAPLREKLFSANNHPESSGLAAWE